MNNRTTNDFWLAYDRLPLNIQQLAQKAFEVFKANPSHPSLHFKKVNDNPDVYSVRITLNY